MITTQGCIVAHHALVNDQRWRLRRKAAVVAGQRPSKPPIPMLGSPPPRPADPAGPP